MFDNPTYLATRPNTSDDTWNMDNKNNIEAREFNVVFQKPLRNPKLGMYLYHTKKKLYARLGECAFKCIYSKRL